MKNNLKGSNNTPLLLIIVTFLSTVGYQILFGQIGILKGTANGTVISKKWLLTNFLKFVLFAGQSLLLVSVGYFSPDIKSKLNVIFRWWMSIVVMGVILALGWMFFDQWSNSSVIWLVALPMIRNTYPLLTAAIVGTLLSGFVDTTWREHKETFLIFATVLFFVPTIFNQDIFVTQINGMPTFIEYLLMCFLGVTLRHLNLNNISRMHWLLITGLTFFLAAVSLILMIPLSNFSHQGISTVNRFLQPYSILTYLIAGSTFALVVNTRKVKKTGFIRFFEPSWMWIVSAIVFLTNPQFASFIRATTFGKLSGFKNLHSLMSVVLYTLYLACAIYALSVLTMFVTQKMLRTREFEKRIKGLQKLFEQPIVGLKKMRLAIQTNRANIFAFLWLYALVVSSMLLMNKSWFISPNPGVRINIILYIFLFREPVIFLNLLFVGLLFLLLRRFTKHYWFSLMFVSAFMAIVISANLIKITSRDEPILPSDLSEMTAIGSLLKMVGTTTVIVVITGLAFLIAFAIWLEKRYPIRAEPVSKNKTITLLVICIISFGSTFLWNHDHFVFKGIANLADDSRMFYNQELGAQTNGPIVQFLNNLDVSIMDEPSGYSKAEVQKVVERYRVTANKINKTRTTSLKNQTVIMNLSESFSNPNRVPNLRVTPNPMPYIQRLKKQTTSGIMMSSGYGGGTANMEYQSLTGLAISNFSPTLPTPYTQLVTNLKKAPSITNQFDYSSAIHPYFGIYYNRISVYKKFGFNKFSYLGSKYPIKHQHRIGSSPYLSDETAYANTLDQIRGHQGGQFINVITMQNHYPFNVNHYPNHDFSASGSAYASDASKESIENYSQGLSYTDKAVKQFKNQLDKIKKPIIWVWYGDHLAGIYDGDPMAKYGLQLHQTDYFIYANKYSRQHGLRQKKAKYVGPNDFSAMAMTQANAKVSPYYALLTKVHQNLPALAMNTSADNTNTLNSGTQFINDRGHVVNSQKLSIKQRRLLHDYRIIQYDIVAGHQYSLADRFMK